MNQRLAREPVGFAGAVKATLLALVPLALVLGWKPADPAELLSAVGGFGAVVEVWATWWVRANVTPETAVVARESAAMALGENEGRRAAEDDLRALDPAQALDGARPKVRAR